MEDRASSGDPVAIELYALASVVFWTGASLPQALGLQIVNRNSDHSELDCDLTCVCDGGQFSWRIRALPLNILFWPPLWCARKTVSYFELPDAVGGSRALLSFLERLNITRNDPADHYQRAFTENEAWYTDKLKNIAQDLNPRITWARLSRVLFQHIVERTAGNLTYAALLTNTDHKLASVRRHYSSPFVRTLQQTYVDCCRSLTTALFRGGYGLDGLPFEITTSDDAVGSPICATMTAFQNAVRTLKDLISPTNKHWWTVDIHNAYTSYVLLFLSASVSMRGTGAMYQPLKLVDLLTAYTIILDKDSGSGYKGRFVRIPLPMLIQLLLCESYMARLAARFGLPSDRPYFLHEDLTIEEARPGVVEKRLGDLLPLPANAARHFVYTHLQERGVAPEDLDCLHGHWWRGEEPFANSSFNYQRHEKDLLTVLEPLLEEIGFEPIGILAL